MMKAREVVGDFKRWQWPPRAARGGCRLQMSPTIFSSIFLDKFEKSILSCKVSFGTLRCLLAYYKSHGREREK